MIHKENGGHGSGVNAGIHAATGRFFKVVDSDDRVEEKSYRSLLAFMEQSVREGREPDMLLSNYVYDRAGAKRRFVMRPKGLAKNTYFSWQDVGHIWKYHYILMHSIIYRTELLRACGLQLPEHTFYVDNIYAFLPLPYVKTIYYRDVNFYLYYIGREDQSVSDANLLRRVDQYIYVVQIMTRQYRDSLRITEEKACLDYMLDYLEIVLAITCNILNAGREPEYQEKKAALWESIRETDPDIAAELHRRVSLILTNLPGRVGRRISTRVFHFISNLFGLN